MSTCTTTCCPACCMAACCGRRRWARRSRRSTSRRSSRLPGVQVVRIADFVGVVSADEWAVSARGARAQGALERQRAADRPCGPGRLGEEGPVRRRGDDLRQGRRAPGRGAGRRRRGALRHLFVADPVAWLDRPVLRRRRRARRRRHGVDGVAGQPSLPQHLRRAGRPAARQASRRSTSTAPAATA